MPEEINIYIKHFENLIGEQLTEENLKVTNNTINYLIDNQFSPNEIISIIDNVGYKNCITHNDLPDSLWENSLLERDVNKIFL